ncbi:MAG: T9SS type A sorting domain-containing protein [Vicingus serpentipes]|nr:T9SS type A sorting domain-containing protein [Vicingus serpentipes]
MIKKVLILLVFFSLGVIVSAQKDTLLELSTNNLIHTFYNNNINTPNSPYIKKRNHNKTLLSLPFVDDFSQNYIYPNELLWEDMDAHVNSNFPIDPPTYGVATLDGLNSIGYPYNFSFPTAHGIADHLTSNAIDLSSIVDSVFLSFYYQPQGNGNKPETQDSLKLEFLRLSDSTWVRMWGIAGGPTQAFQKVMIPVDTSFQKSGFKFRFLNYATLSGNVDHWNIDYVYLNDNRNHADTALNDVSFITNHFNLLKGYTAMPWQHYLTDTIGHMNDVMNVTYKNNHNADYAIFYKYQVITNNGTGNIIETYPTSTSSKPAFAFSSFTEPQAVYKVSPFLNDFTFPSYFSAQTKVFQIKNYFDFDAGGGVVVDSLRRNDTVRSYQVFGSYYAYDDGSAEVGYGVQGVGAKLAHEFNIKKSDTLTAFQIYFNPIQNNLSNETFRLKVWSSLSPEVEVYSQSAALYTQLEYSNTNEFLNYNLDVPIYLPAGTYYFGWEKISAAFLNVGFDLNTNNKTKIHINTVGVWENGSFNGSLMLRPVFGTFSDPTVSINNPTLSDEDFIVFPNPAKQIIYFNKTGETKSNYTVELIDLSGRTITSSSTFFSNQLDIKNTSNGIYFIRFINLNNDRTIIKKVIISN